MSQLDPPPQVKDFNWIWLKWLNNFYEYVKSEVSSSSSGDVTKVDTPVDNELAVWTGDGTLEGEPNLTYDKVTDEFIAECVTRVRNSDGLLGINDTNTASATAATPKIEFSYGASDTLQSRIRLINRILEIANNDERIDLKPASTTGDKTVKVTGNIEATQDIVLAEQSDHSSTPAATYGYLWVRDDAPTVLVFTDDDGGDHDLNPAATVTYDTWTPVLSDGTTESTMTNQDGTYALIGDMVFITCNITVNTVGGSGAARITGLPFTAYNESAEHDYPLSVGEASSLATAANENVVVAQVENNTAYITLHLWDLSIGGATKAMTVAEVSNSGVLRLNGFYRRA